MERPGPLASQEEYELWHATHCDSCGKPHDTSKDSYCPSCQAKENAAYRQERLMELMETVPDWKLTAIAKLIEEEPMEVDGATLKVINDDGSRFYLASDWYGNALYHMVTISGDSAILEQCDQTEKYQQRIIFGGQEIPLLISQLLKSWLATQEPRPANGGSFDDDLGDLDSAIF